VMNQLHLERADPDRSLAEAYQYKAGDDDANAN
jgi:hypothetical protein